MMDIFKGNSELNNIVNTFYEKAEEENIENIDNYLKNIENNIIVDFNTISSICVNKNRMISLKLFNMEFNNTMFRYLGLTKKSFNEMINNLGKIKYLQCQQSEYYTNFVSNFDEIEMILIHSLKQYYKIVKEVGEYKDLKEIYAIYQTVGLYIINMLPEYYRRDIDVNEIFEDINIIDYKIDNASNIYIINIDYILRDYIKEKYDVDLFEYSYSEQRKRMINKKD